MDMHVLSDRLMGWQLIFLVWLKCDVEALVKVEICKGMEEVSWKICFVRLSLLIVGKQ